MDRLTEHLDSLRSMDPKLEVTRTHDRAAVALLRGKLAPPVPVAELDRSPEAVARRFLASHQVLLGVVPVSSLVHARVNTSRRGTRHVIFQQQHGGADVLGGSLTVHYAPDGSVYMLNSSLAHDIDAPTTPTLDADRAGAAALRHAGAAHRLFEGGRPVLMIAPAELLHLTPRGGRRYVLCWRVLLSGPGGERNQDWTYFVDATTGDILLRHPTARTGTGTGGYSTGTALNTEFSSGTYRLRDTITSAGWPGTPKPVVSTYDDNGSTSLGLTNYSVDSNDNWDNGGAIPAARRDDQRPEVDIDRFVGYVLAYYYDTFGYDGIDGHGHSVIAHAHNEYLSNNAFWMPSAQAIYFADGDGTTRSFMCPLDTVAHEFTHGVKYYQNILQTYDGETGALDEATSDLMGAFVALAHPADDPWPWIHGRQYRLDGSIGRNMADPSRDDHGVVRYDATNDSTKQASIQAGWFPDHYSIRYTGAWDNHGVHGNCPIITHALYLMAHGGTHRLSNVHVTGIGAAVIEQLLWEVLSTGVLTNTSTFADFRLAVITACQNLYPDNVGYLAAVKSGFHAVGIGPDLYVRDWLTDAGDEPGALSSMSPDIIVRQAKADAALLGQIADANNAGLGQVMQLGAGDHYAYFRVFNRGSAAAPGTFRLFLSPVSSFPTPATWHEIGHYDFASIAPGGMWVPGSANDCLTIPASLISSLGAGHFCFIGIIESAADPAPDRNQIDDVNEFHAFISASNNYAWRNCDIKDVTPDANGEFAPVNQVFRINGFGRRPVPRFFELDTRDLPPGAEVVLWLPEQRVTGLKAANAVIDARAPRKVADALVRPTVAGVRAFPLAELLRRGHQPAPAPDGIPAAELRRWRALCVPAGRLVQLEGLAPRGNETVNVHVVMKLPGRTGTRDMTVTFREGTKAGLLGQLSFVYRVRPFLRIELPVREPVEHAPIPVPVPARPPVPA